MTAHSQTLRGLYAVTVPTLTPGANLITAVAAAIHGGASMVQYRDKSCDDTRREREARALLQLCHDHDVPLIINDDVKLATAVGADGVHLGKDDALLDEARVQLGPHAIIGVSCYASLDRAVAAVHAGADYVAFGSFFSSPSKPHAARAPIALLTDARHKLPVPVCAIGGITSQNGGALIQAGADMLAVISGLFAEHDVEAAAQRYAQLFKPE